MGAAAGHPRSAGTTECFVLRLRHTALWQLAAMRLAREHRHRRTTARVVLARHRGGKPTGLGGVGFLPLPRLRARGPHDTERRLWGQAHVATNRGSDRSAEAG